MSGVSFFQTAMGRRLYEVTLPKIADELAHLNTTISALVAEVKASSGRANPPPTGVPPADTGESWKASLATIARQHLRIDTLEPRGADSLDFHEVGVAALRSALMAAYGAGLAAGLHHLCMNAPTSGPADGSAEPRQRSQGTTMKISELITAIAREHLGLEALDAPGADTTDTHQLDIVSLRNTLEAAYRAGFDVQVLE